MADYFDRRICPFCGEEFALGTCPIVATGTGGIREINARLSAGLLAYDQCGFVQPATERSRPDEGSAQFSDRGGQGSTRTAPYRPDWHPEYIKVAYPLPPPAPPEGGRIRRAFADHSSELGSPEDLAAHIRIRGLLPARACPQCSHPLPRAIDDREVYTIVVAGVTGASKTTFQRELLRASVPHAHERHFAEFAISEESPTELLSILEQDRSVYLGTQMADRFPPWILLATGHELRNPALLFLYDLPGEVFSNRHLRAEVAEYLRWSDGLIFLVDPANFAVKGQLQAIMLEGMISALSTEAHIAVVLAKADLVGAAADRAYSDAEVRDMIGQIGGENLIRAAATAGPVGRGRLRVSFHLAAGNPGGDGKSAPFGVFESFHAMLANTDVR